MALMHYPFFHSPVEFEPIRYSIFRRPRFRPLSTFDVFEEFMPNFDELFEKRDEMKIESKDDKIVLHGSMHGVPQENIKVNIEDGVLKISGQYSNKKEEGDSEKKRKREEHREFSKCYSLPEGVSESDVKAVLDDESGVLSIEIPKRKKVVHDVPIAIKEKAEKHDEEMSNEENSNKSEKAKGKEAEAEGEKMDVEQ